MSKGREIRVYDYVNQPYDTVRDALSEQPADIFQSATKAASTRARSLASELRINIAGLQIAKDIAITVHEIEEEPKGVRSPPVTKVHLEWEATTAPRFFPFMKADLSLYALTATETQLEFVGLYEPPLGVIGSVLDAIVGHRVAHASVQRFLADVASYLRRTHG